MYGCERRENVHRVGCHIIIQFLILSGPIGISFQDNLVPSFLVKRDTRKIPNNLSIRLGFQLSMREARQGWRDGLREVTSQASTIVLHSCCLRAELAMTARTRPAAADTTHRSRPHLAHTHNTTAICVGYCKTKPINARASALRESGSIGEVSLSSNQLWGETPSLCWRTTQLVGTSVNDGYSPTQFSGLSQNHRGWSDQVIISASDDLMLSHHPCQRHPSRATEVRSMATLRTWTIGLHSPFRLCGPPSSFCTLASATAG